MSIRLRTSPALRTVAAVAALTLAAPAPPAIARPPLHAPALIIGNDDRVHEAGPGYAPWRSIVYLEDDLAGSCSGVLVAPDVVLTAAHCLFNPPWGGALTWYMVAPAVDAGSPFAPCYGNGSDAHVPENWDLAQNGGSGLDPDDYDFGILKLRCRIGDQAGVFGWYSDPNANLVGSTSYVEGFPADKPYATMWWDYGYIASQTARKLVYSNDIWFGMSGSPIYRYQDGPQCAGWCVIGIANRAGADLNQGVRIWSDVAYLINYWTNQPPNH